MDDDIERDSGRTLTTDISFDWGEATMGGDGIRKGVDREGESGRDIGDFKALLRGTDILVTSNITNTATQQLALVRVDK